METYIILVFSLSTKPRHKYDDVPAIFSNVYAALALREVKFLTGHTERSGSWWRRVADNFVL